MNNTTDKVEEKTASEKDQHVENRGEERSKLADIQAAGDAKWEEIKDGLGGVWTRIKCGVEKVKGKF